MNPTRRSHPRRTAGTHGLLRKGLVAGGVIVVLGSATTLAVASHRIKAEQAAFRAPAAGALLPAHAQPLGGAAGHERQRLAAAGLLRRLARARRSACSERPPQRSAACACAARTAARTAGGCAPTRRATARASCRPSRSRRARRSRCAGDGQGRRAQRSASPSTSSSPREDVLPYSTPTPPRARTPTRSSTSARAPDLEPPSLRRHGALGRERAGRHLHRPLHRPGPGRPDDLRRSRQPRVVPARCRRNRAAANLQVQQLGGKPVLTWWQGYIPPQGFGEGEEMIADSSYQQIGRVHAGNGYKADLHDFHITPQGTALLTVVQPDRLQPLGRRRPARRRGDRQHLPGNRPAHGPRARASGTASTTSPLADSYSSA